MSYFKGGIKLIKNKWMLYLSLILLLTTMALSLPFPHKSPYGEAVITVLNIPIRFGDGFHTVGITSLLLLILGLYFLVKSLNKYQGGIVVIAILIVTFVPTFAVNSFQKSFATGIYAVSYSSEETNCNFDMISEKTLHGDCELYFKNHSNNDVQFTVEFYEELAFKDDLPMVSLMNNDAPYKVMLGAKESKRIQIETDIDVSDMKNHIEGGEATGVNIILKSKGENRDL